MKKILLLVLCIMFVSSMLFIGIGCKEDAVEEDAVEEDAVEEDAVEEDAVEEDAVEEDAVEEDAVEEDAEEVTLTYWDYPGVPVFEAMRENTNNFMAKYPNVTVEIQQVAYDTVYEQVAVALSTGSAPDVFHGSINWLVALMQNGFLIPINDSVEIDAYPAGAIEAGSVGDNLYVIGTSGAAFAMMVNRTLFEEAGVSDLLPEDAYDTWNFDDFYEGCKAVAALGDNKYGYAIPGGNEQGDQADYIMMQGFGAKMFNEDYTECLMNSPEGVEAMEFYKKLVDEELVIPGAAGLLAGDVYPIFNEGLLGVVYGNVWQVAGALVGMEEGTIPEFDIDMINFPCKEGVGGPFTNKSISGYSVLDSGDEVRIKWAKKLVEFLTMDEQELVRGDGTLKDIMAAQIDQESVVALNAVFYQFAGDIGFNARNYSERRAAFYPNLQAIIIGSMTAQEALDKAAEDWTELANTLPIE